MSIRTQISIQGVCCGVAVSIVMGAAYAAGPITSKAGYRITPPSGWTVNRQKMMGADLFMFAPKENGFASNLNVMVLPAPAGATLETGRSQMKAMFQKMFTGYKQLSQSNLSLDGAHGLDTVSTYMMGTPPMRMRMHQVIALKNRKVYTFTATSPDASHAKYDSAFNGALKSIHWTVHGSMRSDI